MKFHKKKMEVEAIQFDELCWRIFPGVSMDNASGYFIETSWGPKEITHGDWIVFGKDNKTYTCKQKSFEANYKKSK